MNIFGLLKNNYFSLFVKREGKVVLGKSYSNLWLLVGVLTATFLAISFSNASLKYLKHKMDDPFINWVDMKSEFGQQQAFMNLENALASDGLKEEYHIDSYQSDYISNYFFCDTKGGHLNYLKIRFFEDFKSNDLVAAILEDKNVVKDWKFPDMEEELDENTIGVVLTEEALRKLGYTEAPSYIHYYSPSDYADQYGFDMLAGEYVASPIPVLGVVKRLPGNVDMIAAAYLYNQLENRDSHPFYMDKEEYGSTINYFVPADVDFDKFQEFVNEILDRYPDSEYESDPYFWNNKILPFRHKDCEFLKIEPEYVNFDEIREINAAIMAEYGDKDVHRVFDIDFSPYVSDLTSFLSVNFNKLDKIVEFEEFVNKEFEITIEMSQINAKENFNAVSTMANILSWAIIVFAIICIILFIVNLLQSYFQKVKRNLGTFKAFGMGNYELISVYTLIMAATILVSVVISLAAVWLSQGILELLNITRDEVFGYLSLWNGKTVSAILVIIFASVFTVYTVMNRLLRSTPGDLIYDR